MKKLITENEKREIRRMNSLDEAWFSDILDKLKVDTVFDEMKKKFKEITGIKFEDKEKVGNVTKEYSSYKIEEPDYDDIKFYEKILDELDAPASKENLLFFYAWRQAEGAEATFNPFNTTHAKDKSTFWNCLKKTDKDKKCIGGVRNYETEKDGIDATVKTLKNGFYDCILDGLRKDKGAKKIANCSRDLRKWGTKDGIEKVLDSKQINPPAISNRLVKKV